VKAGGRGRDALTAVVPAGALRERLLASLDSDRVDLEGALAEAGQPRLYPALVGEAARLNTGPLVESTRAEPRFRAEANRKPPRKFGSSLALFDCINCVKCLPACPQGANFVYEVEPLSRPFPRFRLEGDTLIEELWGTFRLEASHQIANFQDFCNDCGNCDTFCPEDGGPYVEKPRFFGSLESWRRWRDRDGYFVLREAELDAAWGRIGGVEYHLEVDRAKDRGLFTDGRLRIETRHSERRILDARPEPDATDGCSLDFSAYLVLATALDGVIDTRRANPVNAAWL
jgi:putative selenate reductase